MPEFKKGKIGQSKRSKGTVQADFWQFKVFSSRSSLRNNRLFAVVTRNDFPWGESLCNSEEDYALVISLRDRENADARLYSQIKAQIEARAAGKSQGVRGAHFVEGGRVTIKYAVLEKEIMSISPPMV